MLGACPRAVSVMGRSHLWEAWLEIHGEVWFDYPSRPGAGPSGRAAALGLRAEGSGVTAAYLVAGKAV